MSSAIFAADLAVLFDETWLVAFISFPQHACIDFVVDGFLAL
jgi:hypothetical protein